MIGPELSSILSKCTVQQMAVSLNGILGAVVEFGRDGVTITDNQIEPPGPHILYVNQAFSRITGYSSEEVVGKSPRILQGPRTERAVTQRLRNCLLHGEPFFGETYNYRNDGTEFVMEWQVSPITDPSGAITNWVGIQRDVTSRHRDAEALRCSLAKWQSVVDTAPDFVVILDRNGKIEFINRTDSRVNKSDVVDHSIFDFVDTKFRAQLQQAISLTLQTGEFSQIEFLTQVAGDPVWYRARFGPYRENLDIVGVVCMATDISAFKRSEQLATQRMEELARVLRLGSMNEMAASLAHELNQPLTVVSNYASGARRILEACLPSDADASQNIRMSSAQSKELQEILKRVADQSRSAGKIVSRWKQFIMKTDAHRSTVNLSALLDEVIAFVRPYADSFGSSVIHVAKGSSPPVSVDRIQIQQVLVNLLNNAFEAMLTVPNEQRTVVVTTTAKDSEVEVEVWNPGNQLSDLEIQRAFEPFFTTKRKGLGMGLSVSKTIIELHHGRMDAGPSPSGGMTFRFTLPTIEDP